MSSVWCGRLSHLHQFIFRAYVRPDVLVNDTDTSDLDDKDDLIIFLTTAYLFGRLGEYDRANRFFAIFKDEMNEARLDDLDTPDKDIKPRIAPLVQIGDYWKDPFVRSSR